MKTATYCLTAVCGFLVLLVLVLLPSCSPVLPYSPARATASALNLTATHVFATAQAFGLTHTAVFHEIGLTLQPTQLALKEQNDQQRDAVVAATTASCLIVPAFSLVLVTSALLLKLFRGARRR